RGDGAVRGAPGDNEQVAVGIAYRNDVRNILRDGFDFGCADANHFFVVQGLVVDVPGDVLLFKAADAVFKAGSAGNGPGARQRIGIAAVGPAVGSIGR